MKRFFLILAIIIGTAILMALTTGTLGAADTKVLGFPVVGIGDFSWLTVVGGSGVLVVGLFGVGGVCITLYGAGVLFATGQVAVGLLALGQVGLGLIMWFGQVGFGTVAVAQGAFGAIVLGQVQATNNAEAFFKRLNEELQETFKLGLIDWLRRKLWMPPPKG